MLKRCGRCQIEKDLSEFAFRKEGKDNLESWCKLCQTEYRKQYREKNKEKINEYVKDNKERKQKYDFFYYKQNKLKKDAQTKAWVEKNKERSLQIKRKYKKGNRGKVAEYVKEYVKKINVRLSYSLRSRLKRALKNNQKTGSAIRDLGCSIKDLKIYLKSKFKTGMTWDNYGKCGWHIDHIRPLASFDLTKREQILEACHYTNLQPLWAKENLSKGASYG
jgi:hypothetical protein